MTMVVHYWIWKMKLEREIEKCGYLPGSAEWQVYSDYLIGAIGYEDLSSYAVGGTIGWDLVKCATKAKERLSGATIGKELENWKREAQEEQDYFENKQKLGKSPGRDFELSPFEQEGLLEEFVDEQIDDAEWEMYLKHGKISKSIYDAGFIERDLEWKKIGNVGGNKKKKVKKLVDLLPVKQVQGIIKQVASGKVTLKAWKSMFDAGKVTSKEYEEGVARKRANVADAKVPLNPSLEVLDKIPRMEALLREFVKGHIGIAQWDLMFTAGSISKGIYEEGIAKKKQQKSFKSASADSILMNKFVTGEIDKSKWDALYAEKSVSKKVWEQGLERKNLAQLGVTIKDVPPTPKTLKSDKPSTQMSREDGLELVRQFALGSIDTVEWEHMINKRKIPLWVYDRGHMERKHYISHGYFTEYMNRKSLPPAVKSFEEPELSEGASCSACEEMIDRFIKGNITYQGWLLMRASGEISGDTFLQGIKKSTV